MWKKIPGLAAETSLSVDVTRVETRVAFLNSIHQKSLRSLITVMYYSHIDFMKILTFM